MTPCGCLAIQKTGLFFSLLLFPLLTWSQDNSTIDSLWQEYAQTTEDSTRLTRLAEIASQYLRTPQRDTAIMLAQQALEEARELNLPQVQATAFISLGEAYDVMGQLEPALEQFAAALEIGLDTDNEKIITRAFNSRGLAYHYSGDFKNAITDYTEALKLARKRKDKRKEAAILQNMGRSYTAITNYFGALSSYLDARNIKDSLYQFRDSTLTPRERVSAHLNLGALYQELRQFEQAKESYQRALDLTPSSDPEARMVIIFNIGTVEEKLENFDAAKQNYEESLELVNDNKIERRKAGTLLALGNIALEQGFNEIAGNYYDQTVEMLSQVPNPIIRIDLLNGRSEWYLNKFDFTAATTDAEEALQLAQTRNYPKGQSEAHRLLARIAEQTQNWSAATTHLRAYVMWKDSLQNIDHQREFIGLLAVKDVELAQKQHKIELAEQETELTRARNRLLWIGQIVLAIAVIGLLILAILFFNSNRKLKKANQEISESNFKLGSINQLLEFANRKLKQFAFASAHDLKESLRNITSFTQLAQIEIPQNPPTAIQHLQEVISGSKRMRKMLEDLLTIINLSVDEDIEVNVPLAEVITSVRQQLEEDIVHSQGEVSLVTPILLKANRNTIEQLFYNLVHNAIQYARPNMAPQVVIDAQKVDNQIVFQVQDNGRGVAPAQREAIFKSFHRLHDRHQSGSGLGLSICKRIVEEQGGRIWYEDRADGQTGAVFKFTLPKAQPKVLSGVLD